jgi:N-acetylglucosaminyl-diphospho-decaprenol L-rhamnosyltransferase
MAIFISVISHSHSTLINKLNCLSHIARTFKVIIKSNKPNDNLEKLNKIKNIHWIDDQHFCGFGHNNNIVFNYCCSALGMTKDDYFIVLNPDVVIFAQDLYNLVERMENDQLQLSAINLYKNNDLSEYDTSIRRFPTLLQFVKSFLGFGNSSIIDKSKLIGVSQVDWAAGSFLAFKASHYEYLQGFDENYFMYCEDIDICYRSKKMGCPVTYHSNIKAMHLAEHANRKIFSRHFVWHISSVLRFLLTKLGLTTPRSSIKTRNFQ